MKKSSAARARDEARERLKTLTTSESAPGLEQASRALEKAQEAPKPGGAGRKDRSAKKKPLKEPIPAHNGKAEKVSVSLHPQDQAHVAAVEDVLLDKGLIARRAPTSFLLKVALAAFVAKGKDLGKIVKEIQGQDGRRSSAR